jgi:hypothetical protein
MALGLSELERFRSGEWGMTAENGSEQAKGDKSIDSTTISEP